MKKLLAILVVATMLVSVFAMTPVMNAATADTVIESAEGTAVIDGVKDDAYANAVELVFDQCGSSNGAGAVLDTPAAHGYVINDAEWVYVFYDVHDTDLDNTSTNSYEQDSIELFYMDNNTKVQWRIHYDETNTDADMTKVPKDQYAVVVGDNGYTVEAKIPITDVLNNQIEMLMQIDSCSGGKRDATVYITGHPEGDDGWQRDNRQTDYDCWWTLQLVGDFEDTRVDPVPEAQEITAKNYEDIVSRRFDTQLFVQDIVSWGWIGMGMGPSVNFGDTDVALEWTGLYQPVAADALNADNTNSFTSAPKFAIQVADPAMVDGEKEEYGMSYSDITIKATGYDDVVIPGEDRDSIKLTASAADWGMSGNSWEIDLGTPVRDTLGISIEEFSTTYLPAVTDVTLTMSFNSYNLNDKATVDEFVTGLAALEQEWVENNDKVTDGIAKAAAALEAAQAEGADLAGALSDATKAFNAANKARENEGWAEGGIADTYIKENIGSVVDQIQALVDAAPVEEPAEEPADDAPEAPSTADTSSSSEGGSTGLVVGIVVAVVVVIAAVCGIVLGKKKK